MIDQFKQWKAFMLENESLFQPEVSETEHAQTISNSIVVYGQPGSCNIGVWQQAESSEIHIFCQNTFGRFFIKRPFSGENVNGPVHQHLDVEIGIVIEGIARQSFGGKVCEFKEGDMWIVDRNVFHNDIYNPENMTTLFISIPAELFDASFIQDANGDMIRQFLTVALLKNAKYRQYLHLTPKRNADYCYRIFNQIVIELKNRDVGFSDIIRGLLARLIQSMAVDFDFQLSNETKAQMKTVIFTEVNRYVRNNFQTVTVDELVKVFHYNENYYNRIYREYTGATFAENLRRIRMEQAKHLLEKGELGIEEIIEQVGYRSRASFYKAFQEIYHVSPGQFSRKNK